MRKALFWLGWVVLCALPVIYGVTIYMTQDLPRVEPWKWIVLFVAIVMIFFSRDRDEVLKHHLT